MINILQKIVEFKKDEVTRLKMKTSIQAFKDSEYFTRSPLSFSEKLKAAHSVGIIAEYKRSSPSKGVINDHAEITQTVKGYNAAGASCLSVLTESKFFGGCIEDLMKVRESVSLPILRKDFIVDEFQLYEAKAAGADAILLIASLLSKKKMEDLVEIAHILGLEVLTEIHNKEELLKVSPHTDIVGVNNRNLGTMEVSILNSIELAPYLPSEKLKISESGIKGASDIFRLQQVGYAGYLIGETFMRTENPSKTCAEFIIAVKEYVQTRESK
jgi:indole-3-glycerol phosphate synthase